MHEVTEQPQLPLLSEKRLGHATEFQLAAYCDVHDLIAIVHSPTGDVVIYRINGQVVFTIKGRPEDAQVAAMKWKPDGNLLGIGWTDGVCGVYSGENGKLLSQTSVLPTRGQDDWKLDLSPDSGNDGLEDEDVREDGRVPVCVGWTSYAPFSKVQKRDLVRGGLPETVDEAFMESGIDEMYEHTNGNETTKSGLKDLVNSITTLDVTKFLPQLSAIPSHSARGGPDGSKFASQAGVDSVFETRKPPSTSIDSLILSARSGHTNVLLDESVQIGTFDINLKPLLHTSHPECSSQVILSDASDDGVFSLHYIDLPLDSLGSPLLHVIATNTKRLQNLMSYISQTIRCIHHDFTTGLQFPTRLLNNISEELSEKEEGSLVMNLYQLAMTGSFTPTMLEWLTDVVKEPNHKRWDLSVSTMYSSIRDYLFMNLLPALDRLSIAASTLRGHAKLHEGTSKFDVPPELFSSILDQADSLRLVAQKMLLVVMAEFRQFRAFSKWLRVVIEVGIAGPGTKGAIETEEREVPNLDYGLLLAYIQHTLSQSKLSCHLEQRLDMKGTCTMSEFFKHPIITQLKREHTITALEKVDTLKVGDKLSMKNVVDPEALINLPTLTICLSGQVRGAVDSITRWQSKMLPKPQTTPLHGPLSIERDTTILDMRMYPGHGPDNETITCILASSAGANLLLYREIRMQGSKKSDFSEIPFDGQGGKVVTAQLTSEKQCTVLFAQDDGRNSLLSCDFGAYEQGDAQWLRVLHVFASNSGFTAKDFVIGGRRGKMVCVVFGRQGKEWKILDLDDESHTNTGASGGEEMQL